MQDLFDAVDSALAFARGPVTVFKRYEYERYEINGVWGYKYTQFRYAVAVPEKAISFGTVSTYPVDHDDWLVLDMLARRYRTVGTDWTTGILINRPRA